jgi:hypothetical protein
VGAIKIGAGIGAMSISMDDSELARVFQDVDTAIQAGEKKGLWLRTNPSAGDDEMGIEAEGAGLVWAPFSATLQFVFDSDDVPDDVENHIITTRN